MLIITSTLTNQKSIEYFRKNIDNIEWNYVGSDSCGYSPIDTLNFDFIREFKDKINWWAIGNGSLFSDFNFKKIELLSFDFIDEFKDNLRWSSVGSGLKFLLPTHTQETEIYVEYTPIENLPTNFIDRYANKINWDFVGSGLINDRIGNYKKIEELPISFVEKYKNNILWLYVGSGKNNHLGNFTHFNDLPFHFKEQFGDKITICDFIEHYIPSESHCIKNIQKSVIPQHFKKLFTECYLVSASSIKCSICLDSIRSDIHITNCGHIFHEKCINSWKDEQFNRDTDFKCPDCRCEL